MFCGLKSHVTLNWVVISRKAGSPGNLRGRLGPGESEHRSPEVNTELRFRADRPPQQTGSSGRTEVV